MKPDAAVQVGTRYYDLVRIVIALTDAELFEYLVQNSEFRLQAKDVFSVNSRKAFRYDSRRSVASRGRFGPHHHRSPAKASQKPILQRYRH